MQNEDIARVIASFDRVEPAMGQLVTDFYATLFERHPEVRPLFPTDLGEQQKKLGAALSMTARMLRSPERLVPLLENLGRTHVAYGARPEHFGPVGGALLTALSRADAEAWDPALEGSWTTIYGVISDAMTRGMRAAGVSAVA